MTHVLAAAHISRLSPTPDRLRSAGLRQGDRVCVSAPNSPELLALIDGCLRAGIAPVVISASATSREIAEMSADVDASAVLFEEDVRALAAHAGENEPGGLPACRPVHFTSGTSGRPKAVWSGWLDHSEASQWVTDEQGAWGIDASDVHLVCGPLNHSAPLRFALMTLWAGGAVIVPPRFSAEAVTPLLTSATTTFMAPTHLQRLMEYVGATTGEHEPLAHGLRLLAHAGAACPDRVREWAHRAFGIDVVTEFYGSTEGQFTVCPATEWIDHPGTVGRARGGRAMRVGDDGRLWSRPPSYARFEYWGDAQKTAEAWDGEWFTVGDYGRIDQDGYVYLEGRKGDLIITGGVNVYPAEVERVLSNLPGVDTVVAFGLPDETWGQRVCVAVVGSVTESDIRHYADQQLSGYKRPKDVFLVDSLPVTHSGKVDRSAVPALVS